MNNIHASPDLKTAFVTKMKEVVVSVAPITAIVLLLHFFVVPLEAPVLVRFFIGAVLVVIGLTLFLVGVDIAVTPLGSLSGKFIARNRKIWLIVAIGLIFGFLISVAEPGLIVLAQQVNLVSGGVISDMNILLIVSAGMAALVALAFLRIAFGWSLRVVLTILYLIIGVMAIFATSNFLAISFDASGATTGVLAVPFMLALATGVARLKRNGEPTESDNFGLVAIASTGAIIAVLIMQNFTTMGEHIPEADITPEQTTQLLTPFFQEIPSVFRDTLIAIGPLIFIAVVLQFIAFKLPWDGFKKLVKGFGYTFVGLIVFLLGVNAGFMEVGTLLGDGLADSSNITIVLLGFVLGVVTIVAEPAVNVLTHEIEEITHGAVSRRSVLIALATGVGLAIAIAMMRIVIPSLSLWHFLLPGYLISLILAYLVPDMFVGMAFDAGGVATGPITATFILAFTQGVAHATAGASILIDGFGMIALVAMMPIITVQLLGLVYRAKHPESAKRLQEKRQNSTEPLPASNREIALNPPIVSPIIEESVIISESEIEPNTLLTTLCA